MPALNDYERALYEARANYDDADRAAWDPDNREARQAKRAARLAMIAAAEALLTAHPGGTANFSPAAIRRIIASFKR